MGPYWSWFYFLRVPFMAWITWRVTKMLYRKLRDNYNGKEDPVYTFQNESMYEDLYFDREDLRTNNFRYSDHRDRRDSHDINHYTSLALKPDAEKSEQAWRWYKHGNNGILDRLFKY
jgi:hypothetical protein